VNDGKLLVTGNGTSLLLKSDVLNDFATAGGAILVDGTDAAHRSTLELQTTTIDGGNLGSLTNHGLTEATSGTASTIKDFTGGNFVSDGTLWVTGNGTSLLLKSDVLNDFATAGGAILVDGTDAAHRSTLELQTTTIDGVNRDSLTNHGLTEATSGPASTIKDVTVGNFVSDGTLWVTGNGTSLLLKSDVLNDFATAGGAILVHGTDAAHRSTLELQTTTIDGGNLGSLTNHGL